MPTVKWEKGKSGNPKGKKKGTLERYKQQDQIELRKLLSADFPKVVAKAIELALEGNENCIKLIMDKMIPSLKAIEHTGTTGDTNNTIVITSPSGEHHQVTMDRLNNIITQGRKAIDVIPLEPDEGNT